MNRWILAALLVCHTVAAAQADPQTNPADPDLSAERQEQPQDTMDSAEPQTPAEPQLSARGQYNKALGLLSSGALAPAMETFLLARDEAGPDGELRYRSAFNLGVVLSGQADEQQAEDPEQAIELLRNAAAWFNDAIRLAPDNDDDARINLELVLKRIQQLADQLNQGNRLEARLDRIIDDQRNLRDRVRQLLGAIAAENAEAEPLGFQRQFEELATFERVLLAEAGSIGDLAAEERALIEEKPEDQRSQQESVRQIQLQGLDYYLQQARQSLSDARRRLRRLEAERSHDRIDAGLAELKRAREQLLDPVTVLKSVAQDEMSLMAHTQVLDRIERGNFRLDNDQPPPEAPVWLTSDHLHLRQSMVTSRASEVLARFAAGANAPANDELEVDPQQRRALQAARQALPYLETAVAAMKETETRLFSNELAMAELSEAQALEALMRAIEQFAGVRELIDLAYTDQSQLLNLLNPEDSEPAADMSTQDRLDAISAVVGNNLDRLERLEDMLVAEQAEAEAQQAAQAQGGSSPAPDGNTALAEKYEQAESLRAQARQSLSELERRLESESEDLLTPAQDTHVSLEELRRLFFNLVEHLRELLDEQTKTYDSTATLGFEAVVERLVPELGLAAERQAGHAAMGDALSQALAQQADQAGAGGDPQQAEAAANMAQAAQEVRQAAGRMSSAEAMLTGAAQTAGSMSPDVEPALADQLAAMEHLETALRLLQPPQQSDQGDQQQQQQQQQEQQSEQEEMSQRQALRRLQAIRDREAERQRRKQQQPAQPVPVEKDW